MRILKIKGETPPRDPDLLVSLSPSAYGVRLHIELEGENKGQSLLELRQNAEGKLYLSMLQLNKDMAEKVGIVITDLGFVDTFYLGGGL
jgi:hypothetical protein